MSASMTPFGRVAVVAHQIHRQLLELRALPEVGEGLDLTAALDDGDGKPRQVVRIEVSERKSLFRRGPRLQPVIRHPAEVVHDRRHFGGGQHPEASAILLEALHRLPVARAFRSRNRELTQIDQRLLSELDERQTEVGVVMQPVLPHLVEHRRAAEVVAAFQEQSNERARSGRRRRPDRPSRPRCAPARRTSRTRIASRRRAAPCRADRPGWRRSPPGR